MVKTRSAFSLVELMIVVAIIGILAAIVIPELQSHNQQAKEAAAKDNLRTLRQAIERYALEHNDVAPGYAGNNPDLLPSGTIASQQLTDGGYLSTIPENSFNHLNWIHTIQNNQDMPATALEDWGWIYKPATKEIRLSEQGADSQGVLYYDY